MKYVIIYNPANGRISEVVNGSTLAKYWVGEASSLGKHVAELVTRETNISFYNIFRSINNGPSEGKHRSY